MKQLSIKFTQGTTQLYFASAISHLAKITEKKSTVLVTDENVYNAHKNRFNTWNTIVLKAGEDFKTQATVDEVIATMIEMEADRTTTLVGIGGGVISDITGYAAAIYMRGIRFGFVPTSILALVDASIGGKNGVDLGNYKNMVGTIRQPAFILHDISLLKTLPGQEWENGFAEIIKHASIRDAGMFAMLEKNSLKTYQKKKTSLAELIMRNALLKTRIVQKDEFEKGDRRLLNFGHTLGHALEKQYDLMHGQAIAIGMSYACQLSEQLTGFRQTQKLTALLEQYNLPAGVTFDKQKVFEVLKMDKKREKKEMNYVLLEKIGKAVVKAIPLRRLEKFIQDL